jgi:hypothetical protein
MARIRDVLVGHGFTMDRPGSGFFVNTKEILGNSGGFDAVATSLRALRDARETPLRARVVDDRSTVNEIWANGRFTSRRSER